ncbi:MAG TPA: cytochrome ubiquinol oxidase subunit I, partial [Balneolales bacterium]|nr:cytochrome ubiquinol oxidase subunit I [Balneolales bacterium]
MELSAVFLSRLQFALTIMFHYIFPPLTIGLGALMVIMEGLYLKTGNRQYEEMARFWTKIFAVNFAMGVASGIVMEFQFGTNWATYSRFVGDVFGSALAAEGIFAFFLESGFLAVVIFGWDRVSKKLHYFSTIMVSFGSIFSSVWIVVANSWQQTPAGYHLVKHGGVERAEVTNFWSVIFNPSSVERIVHVLIAAFILGAFLVMSISAYYILRNRHLEFASRSFTIGLIFGTVFSILAPVSGHFAAEIVAKYQPPKLAAFEAHYKTGKGPTGMYIIGIPNNQEKKVNYGIQIPGLLSFLVHGNFKTPVQGLNQTPAKNRPPVIIPFYMYHLMIGLGVFFIILTLYACFLLWKGTLFEKRWLLWVFVFAVLGPYLANQAGWIAAEVGRQPWVVYGLLRTSKAVSPAINGTQVLASIIMFGLIYLMLFAVWVYVMDDKIKKGPEEVPVEEMGP